MTANALRSRGIGGNHTGATRREKRHDVMASEVAARHIASPKEALAVEGRNDPTPSEVECDPEAKGQVTPGGSTLDAACPKLANRTGMSRGRDTLEPRTRVRSIALSSDRRSSTLGGSSAFPVEPSSEVVVADPSAACTRNRESPRASVPNQCTNGACRVAAARSTPGLEEARNWSRSVACT